MNSFHRESSQDRAITGGREVACLPGEAGLLLGQAGDELPPFWRSLSCLPISRQGLVAARAVSSAPTVLVLHAITSCKRNVPPTDEVPRCPNFGWVRPGYKSDTKGQPHASVTGTAFPRPCLKGCQQRQSRGLRQRFAASVGSERQNLRVPRGPFRFMGSVSPTASATKWRGETSSCQTVGTLRNSPQQPKPARAVIHPD